jgi:hypothetical protein
MPLIQIFTSQILDPAAGDTLLRDLSSALAAHFDKPERYVMTCLVPTSAMTFGGAPGSTCFAAVKNIGRLTPDKTKKMSADLTARLSRGLQIPSDRIYLEFSEAVGHLWGYDGGTFG